jgi:hypothetical protein
MPDMVLAPAEVAKLVTIANNAIKAQTAKLPATPFHAGAAAGTTITSLFCADYPQAKSILQGLVPLLAWWPAGGALASVVLNALLSVGDAIYAQGCVQPAPVTPVTPPVTTP